MPVQSLQGDSCLDTPLAVSYIPFMGSDTDAISADFPYESRYLDIEGSKMHYIDEGSGDPILFLHGNPTSSYLWRNVIPHLKGQARCIAPDLIGMGKSDKPEIEYRFVDHIRYIEGFIEKLGLRNITLVIHDWGSALGFHYASRHEENVRGIAFMESIVKTWTWDDFPKDFKMGFKFFRTPLVGWLMIGYMNVFIKQLLPKAIVRPLSDEEKRRYAEPYGKVSERVPVWRWPNEIPIDGKPADVAAIIQEYSSWLQGTEMPKLLFHAEPGGIIDKRMVGWCGRNMKNLRSVDIGPGIHYLQEDNPHLIGEEISAWQKAL